MSIFRKKRSAKKASSPRLFFYLFTYLICTLIIPPILLIVTSGNNPDFNHPENISAIIVLAFYIFSKGFMPALITGLCALVFKKLLPNNNLKWLLLVTLTGITATLLLTLKTLVPELSHEWLILAIAGFNILIASSIILFIEKIIKNNKK